MKILTMTFYLLIGAFFALECAWAQVELSPRGSAENVSFPIGPKEEFECPGARSNEGSCELLIRFVPYCFGTNLRSYPGEKSLNSNLKNNGTIITRIEISDSKNDNSKSIFELETSSSLTNAETYVSICQFDSATKQANCDGTVYDVKDWIVQTEVGLDKQGDEYGTFYTVYNRKPLMARSPTDPTKTTRCYYRFTGVNTSGRTSNGTQVTNEVACLTRNELPLNKISVFEVVGATRTELNASQAIGLETVNRVRVKMLKDIPQIPPVVMEDGKYVDQGQRPKVDVTFKQRVNGSVTDLIAIKEKRSFSKPGYKVLRLRYKFPGDDGFCGGFYSPLMFFFTAERPKFIGTSSFPLVKNVSRIFWPESNSPGHFLALDMFGNRNIIHAEQLFGKGGIYTSGFDALARLDDNRDQVIDEKDKAYKDLVLWNDKNGNGVSDVGEVLSLKEMKVISIPLAFETKKKTYGNRAIAMETSTFTFKDKEDKTKTGDVEDIYFSAHPSANAKKK